VTSPAATLPPFPPLLWRSDAVFQRFFIERPTIVDEGSLLRGESLPSQWGEFPDRPRAGLIFPSYSVVTSRVPLFRRSP